MTEVSHGLHPWGPVPVDRQQEQASSGQAPPQTDRRAIVFVHGIFSSHETFTMARERMLARPELAGVEFHYFDYDFNEQMAANGECLAEALIAAGFGMSDRVAIVAHSMGGLVSRFALISQQLAFVRVLFLLGTPNSGAVRLSQLSALSQLVHGATNHLFALYPRRSGVPSLSQAAELIEARMEGFVNAIGIDYISIPGRFYHEDRSVWDPPRHASGAAFSTLEMAFFVFRIGRLGRAHDGIVEEASNHLATCARATEKTDSYGGPRGGRAASYAHLTLHPCNELNHVQIHTDPKVVDIVSDIVATKFTDPPHSLEDWFGALSPEFKVKNALRMLLGQPGG